MANKTKGKKIAAYCAAAIMLSGICYASRYSYPIGAQISVPGKQNPVSGNRIVNVTKPLYVIKEDDFAYTNIQWAKALCPELADYIPKDIPEVEAMPGNIVKISGNNVSIDLSALAGVTPVVFSNIGNGKITPADVPDEEIEIVYGYRDGILLNGTITDYGTTRELDPSTHIHYGRRSGEYDKNVFTNATVYYVNGIINSYKNTVKNTDGFTSGYRETVYNHDGMYISMRKNHGKLYTYPGITESGKEGVYDSDGNMIGTREIEAQAFSRFEILYFPDEDLYQVDLILIDQGSVDAEGDDGNGRHEQESTDTDHIYRIIMLSDYKDFRSVDEWYEYMGDNYIVVEK